MEQFGTEFGENLSHRQITALPHLIRPGSLTDLAKDAGIGRTTLYRWLQDDNFRQQLEYVREETLRLAETELKGMAYKAAGVIYQALEDESPSIRIRAAQAALNQAHKAEYGQRLERRIDGLAEAISLEKHS